MRNDRLTPIERDVLAVLLRGGHSAGGSPTDLERADVALRATEGRP